MYKRWMTHIYVFAGDIHRNAIIYVHICIRIVDLNAMLSLYTGLVLSRRGYIVILPLGLLLLGFFASFLFKTT